MWWICSHRKGRHVSRKCDGFPGWYGASRASLPQLTLLWNHYPVTVTAFDYVRINYRVTATDPVILCRYSWQALEITDTDFLSFRFLRLHVTDADFNCYELDRYMLQQTVVASHWSMCKIFLKVAYSPSMPMAYVEKRAFEMQAYNQFALHTTHACEIHTTFGWHSLWWRVRDGSMGVNQRLLKSRPITMSTTKALT